ncbi:lytic transglycosylase domain-containing protein [Phenylobacterium sp. LjRoot219]|uniref:lytic transglycosylase domain-containing protein n=1 Tax=Phenylobacterium sp. LjRoot219 TaxID=3342283 RepID=UPI003ED0DE71
MHAKTRNALLLTSMILVSGSVAQAQSMDAIGALLQRSEAQSAESGIAAAPVAASQQTVRQPLSASDFTYFRMAVESARRGDVYGARGALAAISDRAARKTATWVLVDYAGDSLTFQEAEQARRDLMAWPRASRRQAAVEKLVETSGKSPRQIIDWFDGLEPTTAQGAMALAQAYRNTGQSAQGAELIRRWWRTKSFELNVQRMMQARFSDVLTPDDHAARADILLYGPQGPAAREMIPLLAADQQLAAYARIAYRGDAFNANELGNSLPQSVAMSPGVAFERAAYLRRRGLTELAAAQLPFFPKVVHTDDQADRLWAERRQLVLAKLKLGDSKGAYAAVAECGFTTGTEAAEAEFYAGWLALTRLKDPERAARHFAVIDRVGTSPITRARALYWQGRAAEAQGNRSAAQSFYAAGAQHATTFYGQLAAEKAGLQLALGDDPLITPGDRARFEGSDVVQGARLLHDEGQRDVFRSFVLALDDILPTAKDQALLIDLVRGYGDQDTSMKIARGAAQRGFILPQRAYPYRTPPQVMGAPEPALVLAITRQESGFDPLVRSGVGARGMMQLMPATAQITARKMGVDYSPSMLDEPDYNMRLGSSFLGQLVGQFSGSYVMAVAGYNAGPGRPPQWAAYCGDPRGGSTDPIDFIECIPFSETRNYVMRVMEGVQVYRAKLNGGSTPISLSADLKRGGYGYSPTIATVTEQAGS